MQLEFSQRAELELAELVRYWEENYSLLAAENLFADIQLQTNRLLQFPGIGRKYAEENARFIVVRSIQIYYLHDAEAEKVIILALYHEKRDPLKFRL